MSARVAGPRGRIAALVAAALGTAAGLPVLPSGPPQQPGAGRPLGEGPLGNDVFLPTSDAAERALAAGDEALAKSRADALDAWSRALSESEAFDCAPVVSGSGLPRGAEAVELAVARRLRAAGPEAVRAWRDRFEAGAGAALAAAGGDPSSLARVERTFPMTRAGTRAALALADLLHESGAGPGASTWLDRARAHADPADRPLVEALARRSEAFRRGSAAEAEDAWRRASGLAIASTVTLATEPSLPVAPQPPGRPLRGIEPGIAILDDGRVCVQGSESLHLVDASGRSESLHLVETVRGHGWVWPPPFAEEGERWPLLPAASRSSVFVVAGRASNAQGNALLAFDAPSGAVRPELAWGYSDAGFLGGDKSLLSIDEVLGPGLWEFEPGPIVVERTLIVQARQWTGERGERPAVDERSVRAWCLGLDTLSGAVRWKRLVASGASGEGRIQGARGFARPAQPLAALSGAVLAGTAIGAAAWIDAVDGRVTATLRYRRGPEGARTWELGSPLPLGAESPGPRPILWCPPDSDRGYVLWPEPGGEFGGAFRIETREIGRDAASFGASGSRAILLAAGSAPPSDAWIPGPEPDSNRSPSRGAIVRPPADSPRRIARSRPTTAPSTSSTSTRSSG